jgi:hemoglobin
MVHQLYEKIGGRGTISNLVKVFYAKVRADEKVGRFFQGTDMDNLYARQAMFLTMLLGGAQRFTGRDLVEAHAGARTLGMDDASFDILMKYFRESLEEINVQSDYVDEVMQRLETTRDQVLGR